MAACKHPKDSRSLLHGYDVICDACGQAVGRVALFPSAVLDAAEAKAVVEMIARYLDYYPNPRVGRDALAKLERAAGTEALAHAR